MADFTQEQVAKASQDLWLEWRQKARTDMFFLCNQVLGYDSVCPKIHGKLIAILQRFDGGTDTLPPKLDGSHYVPFTPNLYDLDGSRNNLIQFPRECFKSTLVSVAHTVQWIINYPHVRILISTATSRLAEQLIEVIESHFRYNEMFRFLFPEFCPQGNVQEWGNKEQFVITCRKTIHKEPTVSMLTTGAVMAGGHYDVHKYDDMVDDKNSQTPEAIAAVQRHFNMMVPLLYREEQPKMKPETYAKWGNSGWRDIVGTRYHFADLYGTLMESDEKSDRPMWNTYVQSALIKGTSARDPKAVAFWPEKISVDYLLQLENQPGGFTMVAAQYYLNPVPDSSGLVKSRDDIKFIPRSVVKQILPTLRLHVTVDLHGMEVGKATADNDYTVMTLAGFGRDGRPYVVDILRGRFTPFEVIENIFKLYADYPNIIDFKIEKDAHARVLLPFLERERARRQKFPNVIALQRDNRTSKQHRIRGLQGWLQNGDVRFVDDLPCKLDLMNEIMYFPKYKHDDILDTLADQMQNADGSFNADVIPNPRYDATQMTQERIFNKFIGFDEQGEPMFSGDQPKGSYSPMTGVI